ncbi:TIGR02611 family protein [Leucobacter sp. 1207-22]|uniref:TIGR02611 family protein n=1 Tax=Leucobacter sp. 1207-22 TaxID=2604456 RepID=UPI0040648910
MSNPYSHDAERAQRMGHPFLKKLTSLRTRIHSRPVLGFFYRLLVGLVGGVLILAGLIMLITPGPGWLTIFMGLAVLGSEFKWSRTLLLWLRQKLTRIWERGKIIKRARSAKRAERRAQRDRNRQSARGASGASGHSQAA